MEIRTDDPSRDAPARLLHEHLADMAQQSAPESIHALDVSALCAPEVTFFTAWADAELLGCGAVLQLDPAHGEIKSMRTAAAHLRKGVARKMLEHLIALARRRRYGRLSLETGSQEAFAPARSLYAAFGFTFCGPFGSYRPDPNSVFMTREL